MSLTPGTKLGPYEIQAPLGAGGMGEVYKAKDLKLGRDIAIKVLREDFASDPERLRRFEQEARAASSLNHPNIVTIHDIGEHEGTRYIAMEYVEGKTLRDMLSGEPLPTKKLLKLSTQIADGLAKAHAAGIVHRDLKPENLMVTTDGLVKILDFGLAKLMPESSVLDSESRTVTKATQEGVILGTMGYMSPEQVRGQAADHRSDLFSFGVVLYEMLSGRPAFSGATPADRMSAILKEDPPVLSAGTREVPENLERILRRCLEKNPGDRFQSARDLGFALDSLSDIREGSAAVMGQRTPRTRMRRSHFFYQTIALVIVLSGLAFLLWHRTTRIRWARQELLPAIETLAKDINMGAEGPNAWAAFDLATEAERYIPDDPILNRLWEPISSRVEIRSEPAGAQVFAKPYSKPDAEWRLFGRTPLDNLRFPAGFSRVKLELEGYETVHDVFWALDIYWSRSPQRFYSLQETDRIPTEMAYVQGREHSLGALGLDHLAAETVNDFLIDRYEVTNEAYKRFVDSEGYKNMEFWKFPFVQDGRELSWGDAMALFEDQTGQHGPSTWEAGDYPDGKQGYPVTGLSWYEAAAYAEFAGKQLPTVYHWDLAAYMRASSEIIPLSNYGQGGLASVGAYQGMSRSGAFDMAGNAREWTFNARDGSEHRFILGGGWNDNVYSFNDAYSQNAFDRSATNGFRCIIPIETDATQGALSRTIELPFRDYYTEQAVSDETFRVFLRQYEYDKTPLNERVESVDEQSSDDWTKETISFDAAYGSERVLAYLFLPKRGKRPYQTLVFFPGSGGFNIGSSEDFQPNGYYLQWTPAVHFAKSGRAVLFPVYKSTFERRDELHSSMPNQSNAYKEHVIFWAKDLRRSIDYLETRSDIDFDKLAYYGVSWGGQMAPVMLAVENRFKAAILPVAGLRFQQSQPEADPFNYLPRVTLPVLMLNGRYDFFYPVETSQRPFFERLGTPREHKKWILYDGSHFLPRTQQAKESLAWLDRYLGPAR